MCRKSPASAAWCGQYQIVLDPDKLRAYNIPHGKVIEAVQKANQETGGSVLELGEAEYMVRASGYLQSLDDFRKIPLMTTDAGVSVRLGDVARIQVGPEMRRGVAELNGEGEVAGGVIVMRSGKNALETIAAVKAKLETLKARPAAGRRNRSDLRPLEPDQARGRQSAGKADRGIHRRRAGLRAVPVSPALGAGRDRHAADRHTGRLHRHVLPGRQRQHHVAGRHCDRHRRDGRCGGGDDRECAQAHRGLEPRASRRDPQRGGPLARHRRCRGRSRAGAVLLAVDHRAVVHSGVYAGSAGRTACSRRWPSPRPTRWRRPPGWRSR